MLSFVLSYSVLWLSRPLLGWRKGKAGASGRSSGWQGKWPEEERQQSDHRQAWGWRTQALWSPKALRAFHWPPPGCPSPFLAAHAWSQSPARLCGYGCRPGSVTCISLCARLCSWRLSFSGLSDCQFVLCASWREKASSCGSRKVCSFSLERLCSCSNTAK